MNGERVAHASMPESVVAGRFRLEGLVGEGGMGQVHRAHDLARNTPVALKIMLGQEAGLAARFAREAELLASLQHPAIVGYVAHGTSAAGLPFLAMDWIDGGDLAKVLARGPLGIEGTVAVLRRIGAALACAHGRGVVHRDLKPGNVMLAGGSPEGAMLVDFGIARPEGVPRGLTRTGAIVGTCGYMAPEQLTGASDLDGRADLFALGCVAYECLTGRPAFGSDGIASVLARILLGELPRVSDALPSVPPTLDALVTRLLQRDRADRVESATALLEALDRLELSAVDPDARTMLAMPGDASVLRAERTPVAVVVAWPRGAALDEPAKEVEIATPGALGVTDEVRTVAARWGGSHAALAGGVAMLAFAQGSSIQERVHRAARAALSLAERVPGWGVSLAVSIAQGDAVLPRAASDGVTEVSSSWRGEGAAGVLVDPSAAAFLGTQFVLEPRGGWSVLVAHAAERDVSRTVLGKSTPCLGREKELRLLEGTLDECIDEQAPRSIVLVAPPGAGKSRIRREFLARAGDGREVRTLVARSDVDTPSSSLATLRSWLAADLELAGLPAPERWARLRERAIPILERGGSTAIQSLVEYLGELADAPPPEPSAGLVAARASARDMRTKLQAALVAWLRGAALAAPLVLVLEDLHWADAASTSLLASAWDGLGDVPILLVSTTWPEGEALHGALWGLRGQQRVRLDPLGRRASERIARHLLGQAVDDATVSRACELSEGNAFLLEEIVRHVGEGRSLDTLPTSAVAVVQERLAGLPKDARRFIRLASVFGERFRPEHVSVMSGSDADAANLSTVLERLRREELVLSPSDERNDRDLWSFRHSLVRRAAYELLTDDDRRAAHLAAGRALAASSEAEDPATIAEHFERGGDFDVMIDWIVRAMSMREVLGDYEAVATLARRGDRPEVAPERRVELVYRAAYADVWRERFEVIGEAAERLARGEFPERCPGWVALTSFVVCLRLLMGEPLDVRAELARIRAVGIPLPADNASLSMACVLCVSVLHLGLLEESLFYRDEVLRMTASPDTPVAWIALRDAYLPWLTMLDDEPGALAQHRHGITLAFEHLSPMRQAEILPHYIGFLMEYGAEDEARAMAVEARLLASELGAPTDDFTLLGEASIATFGAAPRDCRDLLAQQIHPELRHVDLWLRAYCHASPAFACPDDRAAVQTAFDAVAAVAADCGPMLTQACSAQALVAELALMLGEPRRALEAVEVSRRAGDFVCPGTRTRLRLAEVRALRAVGRFDEAEPLAVAAKARVERIAAALSAADARNFLALRSSRETLSL